MTRYAPSHSSKPRNSRTSSKGRGTSSKKSAPGKPVQHLSPEAKKDIVGGLLAVLGVVCVLSFFTPEQGSFTGWFSNVMKGIAGWGGFFIPLALLAIGLWMLFRNVQKFPRVSVGRGTGIVLLFLNLITWFHFVIKGDYTTASLGQGGGYLGAFFYQILLNTLGRPGTGVFLVATLVIALIFVLDLPIAEIVNRVEKRVEQKKAAAPLTARQEKLPIRQSSSKAPAYEDRYDLPDGFNPINLHSEGEKPQIVVTPRKRTSEPALRQEPVRNSTSASSKPSAPAFIPDAKPDIAPIGTVVRPQKPWTLPSVEAILDPATPVSIQSHLDKDRSHIIEETLASFSAPAHVVEVHRGPTVTQFGVEPDFIESRGGRMRVRVAKIASLADDLALALAARSIRIQAPVPGRNYVGIEVPNTEIAVVGLREVIESEAYRKIKSSLKLALGKDVAGKPICADLTSMPHLLIAGTTNSGKSVCVNSILSSLLLTNSPTDLRLVLVDPKRVELTGYNHIPHLLAPVVVDAEKVIGALQWVIREMDARYHKFSDAGVRNITEFNRKSTDEHIPYLVVVIDELADLMMMAPVETEHCITRLAQLARATGIHLIIATQRPSTDVVTGLIKANLPARIAFLVASNVDSRVILDQPGAEKLLGRGDMLYQAPDAPAPVRLQGTYVSDGEITRLVENWKAIAYNNPDAQTDDPFGKASYEMMNANNAPLKQGALWDDGSVVNEDPMLKDAVAVVRREGKASISMLQRRLRVGYTRAARLIDTMEEKKIIGPQQSGSQVREILDFGTEPELPQEEA